MLKCNTNMENRDVVYYDGSLGIVKNRDIVYYDGSLGIDGKLDQLLDWCIRYGDDYSEEALLKISEIANSAYWLCPEKRRIPELVLLARQREGAEDDTLPYEQLQLDLICDNRISYSETKSYGKVEIFTDREYIIVAVTGTDSEGRFTAATRYTKKEFLSGRGNHLEVMIGEILAYSKRYNG